MMKEEMFEVNWFDPYDVEHLRAFDSVRKTGCWPAGFITEDRRLPLLWYFSILQKITDRFYRDLMKQYVVVRLDDWEGLYVDGTLVQQDCSINVDALRALGIDVDVVELEYEDSRLPATLAELTARI